MRDIMTLYGEHIASTHTHAANQKQIHTAQSQPTAYAQTHTNCRSISLPSELVSSILRRVFHVTYTLVLLAVSKLDQVQSQVCESEKENKGGHMFTEHNTQTRRHAMFSSLMCVGKMDCATLL